MPFNNKRQRLVTATLCKFYLPHLPLSVFPYIHHSSNGGVYTNNDNENKSSVIFIKADAMLSIKTLFLLFFKKVKLTSGHDVTKMKVIFFESIIIFLSLLCTHINVTCCLRVNFLLFLILTPSFSVRRIARRRRGVSEREEFSSFFNFTAFEKEK